MKMPLLLLLVLVQIAAIARANIVELPDFRLMPLILAKKQDFTYGTDITTEDDLQALKFDLNLSPQNTVRDQSYGLMLIAADQVNSNRLYSILSNGTKEETPRGVEIGRQGLTSLDDVERLLEPIRKDLAVYDSVVFSGAPNTVVTYN